MKPLYIFDLDGTVALIDHRRPVLNDKSDPDRWDKFHRLCVDDVPNAPVIATLERLLWNGADVWFFSGRSEDVRAETEAWIKANIVFPGWHLKTALVMRASGDYTMDDELKELWFDRMLDEDKQRLVAVFDDRDRVVNMWRRRGVACFQVAPGAF